MLLLIRSRTDLQDASTSTFVLKEHPPSDKWIKITMTVFHVSVTNFNESAFFKMHYLVAENSYLVFFVIDEPDYTILLL